MASAPSDDMWAMILAEATFLSNAAYGKKLESSFELAKGYTPYPNEMQMIKTAVTYCREDAVIWWLTDDRSNVTS